MKPDTDPVDLDDTVPFTRQEIQRWRRVLRDYDRASWAVRKLAPWIVAIAVGVWQLWDWAARHVKVTP